MRLEKWEYAHAVFTVLILVAIAFAIASAITNRFGTMPGTSVEAADNCQQYADSAIAELARSVNATTSWQQTGAFRALAYATLYAGCRGR